ncbi:pyridoxal kinase isoform X2 [Periplaneta americana]|uniref:pyridoxal kinase isoform X2 n=1 Tax=Periplaneta americana TaxID=6978 RepID=UPI0037E83B7B
MAEKSPRVLSIQSHVVSGYVGNKSATFPLQVLGFEVDPINSVQFCNHTGYGYWKGQVLDENELVCDPVMGDNGKMYVPEELLEIYRDTIIPLANIITPNQFEVELLTGKPIQSLSDAWNATEYFHKQGCHTVVVSSSELGDEQNLLSLASSRLGKKKTKLTLNIPKLPGTFTGTGDLFTALLLAWMWRTDNILKTSLENTIATIQAILRRNLNMSEERSKTCATTIARVELPLVQSKADIENPKVIIEAKVVA